MKTKLMADGAGLIVPMNIEAMCVDLTDSAQFAPAPYIFELLPNESSTQTPYLSEKIMASTGKVKLGVGVHLHWALPDGLTRGTIPQDDKGNIIFPNTPDRWMITRVFSDSTNPAGPVNKVKSWVIESNYIAVAQPENQRQSVSVPFKSDNPAEKQYRFLGRVQEYEVWHAEYLRKRDNPQLGDNDNYVEGLSAIG